MLCGIPNVGKSTFINTFAGSAPVSYTHLDVYKRQHLHFELYRKGTACDPADALGLSS